MNMASAVHDKLLRYLRRCVGGEDHPFALPDIPVYLNELLARRTSAAASNLGSAENTSA